MSAGAAACISARSARSEEPVVEQGAQRGGRLLRVVAGDHDAQELDVIQQDLEPEIEAVSQLAQEAVGVSSETTQS